MDKTLNARIEADRLESLSKSITDDANKQRQILLALQQAYIMGFDFAAQIQKECLQSNL